MLIDLINKCIKSLRKEAKPALVFSSNNKAIFDAWKFYAILLTLKNRWNEGEHCTDTSTIQYLDSKFTTKLMNSIHILTVIISVDFWSTTELF